MAFRYPTPFREAACQRMLAGERVEPGMCICGGLLRDRARHGPRPKTGGRVASRLGGLVR
jgi:hypothetical protein